MSDWTSSDGEVYKKRRRPTWSRVKVVLSNVGYRHLIQIILTISIVLQALLLSGCSSSTAFGRAIYVVSFRYNRNVDAGKLGDGLPSSWTNVSALVNATAAASQLEVRASYFGICATWGSGWTCASSFNGLRSPPPGVEVDPLALVYVATRYRQEVLYPGLAIGSMALAAVSFVIFLQYPGWHQEISPDTGSEILIRPFPSRNMSDMNLAALVLSAMFAMLSATWQHTSAATAAVLAEAAGYGRMSATIGGASTALAWVSFLVTLVAAAGVLVLVLSLRALDKLV